MKDQYQGAGKHVFGRIRPILQGHFPVVLDSGTDHRDTKFRKLPDPTGQPPFRLGLEQILGPDEMAVIRAKQRLTFHLNGDMGGIKDAVPQELVAKGMEKSFDPNADASLNPSFLYITGDCVYFNGQVEEYYRQFYEPYEFYPRPIFAVAGNHDGENLDGDGSSSLEGFMRNFCAPHVTHMPEAMDSNRTAMIQPNVYWTLTTPLFNIVGLYSNVPEGGEIKEPQVTWYENELKTLSKDVPLFVALHHPPYSADDHHSGSKRMLEILDAAATRARAGARYGARRTRAQLSANFPHGKRWNHHPLHRHRRRRLPQPAPRHEGEPPGHDRARGTRSGGRTDRDVTQLPG